MVYYFGSVICYFLAIKALLFSFNVFQEIARDEENVRKVSSYLADTVLPKFIQDLCSIEVSPMDGQTLTEALHAHGINVRYIGKVSFVSPLLAFLISSSRSYWKNHPSKLTKWIV